MLAAVRDVSGILGRLLDGGHSAIAGAFRRISRTSFADEIIKTMKSAGYGVRESDPFAERPYVPAIVVGVPPICRPA
ncbi:hypothetical protein [Paramesorhizobium deserti]|uniref:hypothetical protein n=1 Tax=Paramesorhizobium deserti TaxID=1494590 RepID=UPI001FCDF722|nr:hypothetical protein [Paramesorhizobium deserti]